MNVDFPKLATLNYVLKAAKSHNFWFSIHLNKLNNYIAKYGENFNVIIYDGDKSEFMEFYILPYFVVKYLLIENHISNDKRKEKRWVGNIKSHQLHIRNCPFEIDVLAYYGNPNSITEEGQSQQINENEKNEYAIENRIAEIEVRIKQSVFRKNVLLNFNGTCCLTGINETDLIIASHIVPWSKNVNSRLDPSNGLPLFVTYDKLFDLGYMSFENNLRVIVTEKVTTLSPELNKVLKKINGAYAAKPLINNINKEYLEYHRDIILIR